MTWQYNKISGLHIELSTRCNAACPGCPRFLRNSPNVDSEIPQVDITIDNFKKWFSEDFVSNIYNWIFCGTHGDPIACRDLFLILEYICEFSPGNIQINTNGGFRDSKYFERIGELFVNAEQVGKHKPMRTVVFSVDGLKDTNHIYRRNVKWDKVWNNMMAYVSTGARANWDFLQFKHNVHQVDEARNLAKQHGIEFHLKNPFGVDDYSMPVLDKDYNLIYIIEHATKHGKQHYDPAPAGYRAPFPVPVVAEGSIDCMAFRMAPWPFHEQPLMELYVDALGRVHPCCFIGNKMQGQAYVPEATEMQELQKTLGSKNSLFHFSLKDIMDNNVLDVYSNSWKDKTLSQCWVQCGGNDTKERAIDFLFKDNG
jgi:hypothetical protein